MRLEMQKSWASKNVNWLIAGGFVLAIGVVAVVYRSKLKSLAKESLGGYKWFNEGLAWYRDSQTKNIVNTLHPKFRDKVKEFFSRVEKDLGLQMYATSGLRTFEEQAALKKENSSNASPGLSGHNYGFSVDVNVIDKNGKIILKKASTSAEWEKSGVVKIAKDMGFKWGGAGQFGSYHDPVHFFIEPDGKSTQQLLALHNGGKVDGQGYVIV